MLMTTLTYPELLESTFLYPLLTGWKDVFPEVFQAHPCEALPDLLSLAGIDHDTKILLLHKDQTLLASLCYKYGSHPSLSTYKLNPNTIFVYNLFVVPGVRRQGQGHALLSKLEEQEKKTIVLTVLPHNDIAIRFYLKEGYKVRQALEHAFVMEKNLT